MLPSLGAEGDLVFADFRNCRICEPSSDSLEFAFLEDTQEIFNKDRSLIEAKMKVDGQPLIGDSFTHPDGNGEMCLSMILN